MSTIDPKWLQYDENKLSIIDDGGINKLSIKSGIILDSVSVEKVNDSKIEIRETRQGAPLNPGPLDFYIEVPDKV